MVNAIVVTVTTRGTTPNVDGIVLRHTVGHFAWGAVIVYLHLHSNVAVNGGVVAVDVNVVTRRHCPYLVPRLLLYESVVILVAVTSPPY